MQTSGEIALRISYMIYESIQYILDIAFILVSHDNMRVHDFFFFSQGVMDTHI